MTYIIIQSKYNRRYPASSSQPIHSMLRVVEYISLRRTNSVQQLTEVMGAVSAAIDVTADILLCL